MPRFELETAAACRLLAGTRVRVRLRRTHFRLRVPIQKIFHNLAKAKLSAPPVVVCVVSYAANAAFVGPSQYQVLAVSRYGAT